MTAANGKVARNPTGKGLWTVPRLTVAMDSSGTGSREVKQDRSRLERARPRPAHSDLGQAYGSLRLAHRRLDKPALPVGMPFPMEGAGLPTLPTGTITTIFS